MLLSEARSRVRNVIDDVEAERQTTAQVDAALKAGQAEALLWAVSEGSNLFTLEASITSSSAGVVNLSSLTPLRVSGVSIRSGTSRFPVRPCSPMDVLETYAAAETLLVSYVPRPVFPASDSAAFVWSSSAVSVPPLDGLMCMIAASELKITEGEQLAGLEARKEELRKAAKHLIDIPQWTNGPGRASRYPSTRLSGVSWYASAPDTLQLVRT